jgi:hypothetical protein
MREKTTMSVRVLRCSEYINRPCPVVLAELLGNPVDALQRATVRHAGTTPLRVSIGGIALALRVVGVEHDYGRRPATTLVLEWRAVDQLMSPSISATLSVFALSADGTQLALRGVYQRPLEHCDGAPGVSSGDDIAQRALAHLIQDIAAWLRLPVETAASTTARRPAV